MVDHSDSQEATVMGKVSDTFSGAMQKASNTPPALVVLIGPPGYTGKQWLITKPEFTMGRSNDTDISINDGSLSRVHAKIFQEGHDVIIVDNNSTNKTAVNEQILPPSVRCKLNHNDKIRAGNVVFRFFERGSIEVIATQTLIDKAQKDALTGAYSKGSLLERGPELIQRGLNMKEAISVITFDIDFFRKINEGFGHPGGDHVLKELGKLLNEKLVRSNDYLSRYGGEEFVIILQGTTLQAAHEVAERIRKEVESYNFTFQDRKVPVTISLGVAQVKEGETWELVYERADKALYESKHNGRNQVTLAT